MLFKPYDSLTVLELPNKKFIIPFSTVLYQIMRETRFWKLAKLLRPSYHESLDQK